MSTLHVILATLAVYRLAYLISMEAGPANVAIRLREATYRRFGGDSWVFAGVSCPLCVSFWLALVAAVALWPASVGLFLLLWLGIAGGVLVLHRIGGE
jgi:hypothetical protein